MYKDDSLFNGPTDAESMQYGESKYNTIIRDGHVKNFSTEDEPDIDLNLDLVKV